MEIAKTDKQAPPRVETEKIMSVEVELIDVSPFVNHQQRDDEIDELATSIKTHGIMSPLKLRHSAAKIGRYELIFGHRRLAAAKQIGMEKVPCLFQEATDAAVIAMQMVENEQRLGNDIWSQAEALGNLRDAEDISASEIAERIGKPRHWVGRRLRLLDMPKPVAEFLKKKRISMAKIELFMQIDGDTLTEFFKGGRANFFVNDWEEMSTANLAQLLDKRFKNALASAIFEVKDETLLPSVGPCTTCPFRQNNQGDLFNVKTNAIDKSDRCLRPSCYQAKEKAHIIALRTKLNEDDPHAVIVSDVLDDEAMEAGNVLRSYKFDNAKAGQPGAVKLVHIGGSRHGTTSYGKPWEPVEARPKGEGKNKTLPADVLKDKTERWHKRLAGETVRQWCKALESLAIPENVFTMLVSFGSRLNMHYLGSLAPEIIKEKHKDAWLLYKISLANHAASHARAWTLVKDTLLTRLNFQNLNAIDKYLEEAKAQAEMVNEDFRKVEALALKNIPEPKSLVTLRTQINATKKKKRNGKKTARS